MVRLLGLLLLFWIASFAQLRAIYWDAWVDAWIAGDVSFLVEHPPTLCCFYEPAILLEI